MSASQVKPEKDVLDRSPWRGFDDADEFYESERLGDLRARATRYLQAGVPVHFSGAAGLGKTALALRVARQLDRPITVMTGHQWLTASDFQGRSIGTRSSAVVDKYIQSVRRTNSQTREVWQDSLLIEAMKGGHTLVYDEFTRASPEANATLLSVLEEGVLITSDPASPQARLMAHPNFRVIVTSNPHEYVATNSAPDALLDRVVTFPIAEPDEATLTGIIGRRTKLSKDQSHKIASMVCNIFASLKDRPASRLRSALLIARIVQGQKKLTTPELAQVTCDVLMGRGIAVTPKQVEDAMTLKKAAA